MDDFKRIPATLAVLNVTPGSAIAGLAQADDGRVYTLRRSVVLGRFPWAAPLCSPGRVGERGFVVPYRNSYYWTTTKGE